MVLIVKIIKEKIQFEESLKQRLEFICEFAEISLIFKMVVFKNLHFFKS